MKSRTVLTIAAVVLSLVSALAVYIYAATADSRALAQLSPTDAIITAQSVPAGTSLQEALAQGLVTQTQLPSGSLPVGAIQKIDNANQKLRAIAAIPAGQILLRAGFTDQPLQAGALQVPAGKLAVTVNMSDPARVANFLVPGSQIAIFVTGGNPISTRIMIPKVTVLAVGASVQVTKNDDGTTTQTPSSLITLAVTQSESETLVHANSVGQLYFGLLSPSTNISAPRKVVNKSIFG